ncbi:hypothetical protein pipiens_018690 [Culex pipiens pipiens]|uniref:Cysteine proteinase n=1 Tax=Culex pipiens pipiens TaxID=38569 RepID=A0ABD1CAH7_CULPP
MNGWSGKLVVNILILLAITLSAARCQEESAVATEQAETSGGDAASAAGADNVKDEPSTKTGSGESFVAIHVDALGTKEQLRPSLRGLSYIAISFLPQGFSLVEVQTATREVVAGVRYELLAKALDQDQLEVLCALTVLEKPWITTESGDKYRILEHSNCTSPSDETTTVEVVTKLNPIYDPNVRAQQEMTPSRFKDLVNQIIIEKHEVRELTTTTEPATTPGLSESSKDALDQLFLFGSEAQQQRRVETSADERRQEVIEEVIVPKRVEQQNTEATTTEAATATNLTLDQQVQSTFEEVFKTHQEIQKALDEVIQRGGNRDAQLKYEPVFAELLQKVKTSIDNYYRTTNPGGGEANVDTTAFVVSDNVATVTHRVEEDQHNSSESDEDQQVIQPVRDLAPPKIDSVVMHFSDDSDDQQQQEVQRPQTREELLREFNADDSQQRNKRAPRSSSHEHDGHYSPFFGSSSAESHEHYGRPYTGFNPFLNPYNPYNYQYRRKRSVEDLDLNGEDRNEMDHMEKIIAEAIEMLDTMDADQFKRVLLDVVNVKRINQFGSAVEQKGELFVARVVTANSHCIEEAEDVVKCKRLLIDGSSKFCTLEIRVKDQEVRLVKSECAANNAPGGHREVDVSEPEHNERIRNGLQGYNDGSLKSSKFVIRCGTVQVVAGTIYRYTVDLVDEDDQVTASCKVKIFSPLQGDDEYKFDCHEAGKTRSRRDVEKKKLSKAPKTGGALELTPEEFNKPEHQERISGILVSSLGSSEKKYRIVGATQQLVSGTLYTYKVTFNDDPDKLVCKLTSYERIWLKEKSPAEWRKVSYSCPDAPTKRTKRFACAGCPSTLSAEELKNDEHLGRINKILVGTGGDASNKPEVINGTSQVVAGSKYTYFVAFKQDGGDRRVCKFVSWERPWLDGAEAYQYSSSCDGQDESNSVALKRSKRAYGGERLLTEEELGQDEHVKRINKILVANSATEQQTPKVINGTVQVVAGRSFTYYISYPVNGADRVCKLNAWERPWLEKKDPTQAYQYTFNCDGSDEKTRKRRHAKKVGTSNDLTLDDLRDESHVERIRAGLVAYNTEKSKSYQDFEILKGSVQLVAGSLYKYTFKIKGDPSVVCKISVWERVWMEEKDQRKYNVKCDGDEEPEQENQQQHTVAKRSLRPHPNLEAHHYSKSEDHSRHLFDKFKTRHNRTYQSSLEHEMRFRIFKNNLFKIEQLNKYEQGTAKYGITHFADMTSAEYRARTGLVVPREGDEVNHIRNPMAEIDEHMELPDAFDWRELGAVSEVKNQGNCGSCWAFSVVGNIEGLHQVKTKKLEEYSEQELLDCDTVDSACNGGFMDDAYKAIEKIGGLELESEYPYLAKKQKTCHFNKTMAHVRVKGAVDLPKNETAIAQFLVANGPVSIGLNANAMQFYRGGISHPWKPLCSKKNLDHGVLIVGYGVKEYPMFNKTLPYWIVKNSWGPKWGEQGYYRVFRGDNTCGVSEMATSAVLE